MDKRKVDRSQAIQEQWRRERPDLDPSSVGVVTRIWHLAKVFGDHRRRLLSELGVDSALMDLLGTLRRRGEPYEMTTRQLATQCLVSAGAISQRLARAEARGWVTRTRAPGRVVKVQLTGKGKDTADRLAGSIFRADDELLAVLPRKDRQELTRLLKDLTLAIGAPDAPLPRIGADYRPP